MSAREDPYTVRMSAMWDMPFFEYPDTVRASKIQDTPSHEDLHTVHMSKSGMSNRARSAPGFEPDCVGLSGYEDQRLIH